MFGVWSARGISSFRSLIHKCWSYSKDPHRLRRYMDCRLTLFRRHPKKLVLLKSPAPPLALRLFHSHSYPSKLGTSSNKKDQHIRVGLCARDWIRTSTPFPAPPPQGGLSTNFNTRAKEMQY